MKTIKPYVLFLILACIYFSCKKDAPVAEIKNLNNNNVICVGHAGMGESFEYPQDSYEAIYPVLDIGADGFELDLQLTKDSVLVVYHDVMLDTKSSCTGYVNEHSWKDLDGCLLNCPISSKIYLMSADNLFGRLDYNDNNWFYLDLKFHNKTLLKNRSAYVNALVDLIDKNNLKNVVLESPDTLLAMQLISKNTIVKMYYPSNSFRSDAALIKRCGYTGFTTNMNLVTKEDIEYAQSQNIWTCLWGIRTDDDNLKALNLNAEILISDKPISLLQHLGKYKKHQLKGRIRA